MSAMREEDVKAVMKPYVVFLMDKINKIYEAWDNDEIELALRRACHLVFFLPRSLKEQLRPDMGKITDIMNSLGNTTGIDFYTTQLTRSQKAYAVAQQCLKPFVDKMIDLLDERGYLERVRKPIETNIPESFFG